MEDLDAQKGIVSVRDPNDSNDPALLCFMVAEKPWPFCCSLQEVYYYLIKEKTKQTAPIKNVAANLNHITVTRLREVYSALGWLPPVCHDPVL